MDLGLSLLRAYTRRSMQVGRISVSWGGIMGTMDLGLSLLHAFARSSMKGGKVF